MFQEFPMTCTRIARRILWKRRSKSFQCLPHVARGRCWRTGRATAATVRFGRLHHLRSNGKWSYNGCLFARAHFQTCEADQSPMYWGVSPAWTHISWSLAGEFFQLVKCTRDLAPDWYFYWILDHRLHLTIGTPWACHQCCSACSKTWLSADS